MVIFQERFGRVRNFDFNTLDAWLSWYLNEQRLNPNNNNLQTQYSAGVRRLLERWSENSNRPSSPVRRTLQWMYERHHNEILEFALPHDQADTGANELFSELSPNLPSNVPQTRRLHLAMARRSLKVITGRIRLPALDVFINTTPASLPANTRVLQSSTIPTRHRQGLTNVAQLLIGNPTFTANTTLMLALDLTRVGGSYGAYRFTRLDLGTLLGTEILIEHQGTIGIEVLTMQSRAVLRARFDSIGFNRATNLGNIVYPGGTISELSFNPGEFDPVLIGLGEINETLLRPLGVIRFVRAHDYPLIPRVDGLFVSSTTPPTIVLFDSAYSSGLNFVRMGRAGRTLSEAAYTVVHEVGHAIDHSLNYRSMAPAFQQAALSDGGGTRRFPTNYPFNLQGLSNVERQRWIWGEYFAESFALYQTSPGLLQIIRPQVYAYMVSLLQTIGNNPPNPP